MSNSSGKDLEMGTLDEKSPQPGSGVTATRGIGLNGQQIYVPSGYTPEFRVGSNGTIITHDPVLSASAPALIDFINLQASTPPVPTISVSGTHTETRTESYTTTVNGQTQFRTRTVTVTITDFSCSYTLHKEVEAGLGYAIEGVARAAIYSQGEWDLAFRGGNKKAKTASTDVAEMTREERKRLEDDWKARKMRGMPPFVHPASLTDISCDIAAYGPNPPRQFESNYKPARLFQGHFIDLVEDHSIAPFNLPPFWSRYQPILAERNARRDEIDQVARDYCASAKGMKELHVKKGTYGWDWVKLEEDITRIVRATGYNNSIHFSKSTPEKCDIRIRPDSVTGKIFSARWYWKALLWLVLVYPILLIIEYFVGAKFTSIRVAFPLCRWRALPLFPGAPPPCNEAEAAAIAAPLGGNYRWPKVAQLPTDGTWVYMVGLQEEEWIQSVEGKLRNAVTMRQKGVDLG
ncbi:hypothetical protein P7C70_g6441, partial [Phenoliferia sp. Uapishka_3]